MFLRSAPRRLYFLLSLIFLAPSLEAKRLSARIDPRLEIFEETLEEVPSAQCRIFARSIQADVSESQFSRTQAPLVIALNGIPASSWIYRDFAIRLYKQGWNLRLVDLPGTARSKMQNKAVWNEQRACLSSYLSSVREPFILVLHDIAVPIAVPLIPQLTNLRGLLVMNGILKTKGFKPVPPMSSLKTHVIGDLSLMFMGASKFRKNFARLGLAKDVDPIWIEQIFSDVKAEGSKRHLTTILRGFENSEKADALIKSAIQDFKGPKFAIWGMADPSLGSQALLAEELFGKGHFYALTQAKHFPMLDHATEITKAFSENFDGLKKTSKGIEPRRSRARSTL